MSAQQKDIRFLTLLFQLFNKEVIQTSISGMWDIFSDPHSIKIFNWNWEEEAGAYFGSSAGVGEEVGAPKLGGTLHIQHFPIHNSHFNPS